MELVSLTVPTQTGSQTRKNDDPIRALSRRADAEELKEKDRTKTLLPSHLFINLLDAEFSDLLVKIGDSDYDESVLTRLRFLTEEPNAEDSDWAVQIVKE
jgi:hypothetical protein